VTDRLFVYGTLAPGRPNEHVLADLGGTWEPAYVTGTLWEHGWGAALGYPGIVLDERGTDRVDGLVFTAAALEQHWDRLDEFEGEGYRRVLTRATLDDGTVVDTDIYVLAETPAL
jgi:gamma-glutamylcyclotransferase (GGCT)/AIG2-like uncharacterized protein YtfP